ncbi:MAG: sugar ABC transporter substrate-binding protein [Chloroflexota bacterium]|jgi:ribose transport system substrate-binding protein|nr:substrate-binding domain-containing protein [Anaerolineae bacterium CFX8]GIL14654.1 MAG: sugar ABC transporter substrate-binding protein [Chloroflexota bacterium]
MSKPLSRRDFMKSGAAASVGALMASQLAALPAAAQDTSDQEYVYLSIVTQVPFWVDHRAALEDAGKVLGVRTTFTGPVDFDVAGQARQLDEIVARNPAGIVIFPGDAGAITPGINRAVEAGIPVVLVISDAPESKRYSILGINGFQAGRVGGEMLAQAIGGRGKVVIGGFQSPNIIERMEGYKAVFAEKYPDIEVVAEVDDRADPAYAPTAYAAAIAANPDVAGIGGTDGDSGKGAALAVRDAGKVGEIKIVAMDRNDDMLPFIEDGTIYGTVVQKSYTEMFLAVHLLYWLKNDVLKVVPDWRGAGLNILPERVETGVFAVTQENVAQFKR